MLKKIGVASWPAVRETLRVCGESVMMFHSDIASTLAAAALQRTCRFAIFPRRLESYYMNDSTHSCLPSLFWL